MIHCSPLIPISAPDFLLSLHFFIAILGRRSKQKHEKGRGEEDSLRVEFVLGDFLPNSGGIFFSDRAEQNVANLRRTKIALPHTWKSVDNTMGLFFPETFSSSCFLVTLSLKRIEVISCAGLYAHFWLWGIGVLYEYDRSTLHIQTLSV